MKCQIIRDDMEVSPQSLAEHPDYSDRIVRRDVLRNDEMVSVAFWKNGAVLEHPQAFWLVKQACAIPADDDCRLRARMTQKKMDAAKSSYDRLMAGVSVEDYDLYDNGIIAGYNPDGSYKPGPNWDKRDEFLRAEQEEEDDDV
jgi:hypothetical protein